jgi:opacity protein-like surface antigen
LAKWNIPTLFFKTNKFTSGENITTIRILIMGGAIWEQEGGYLGAGFHYNVTPNIFVGLEGKYLWTDRATLDAETYYGVPVDVTFKMDGIIAAGVFGDYDS